MGCFKPLKGYWKDPEKNEGNRGFTYDKNKGYSDRPLDVPCGQCMGCRLERARIWAIRCMHEASLYDGSSFITLTYSDENLPYRENLIKADIQNFHKRLRRKVPPFRFFYCGEYGESLGRPHFHTILFGFDPPDKEFVSNSKSGEPLYESEILTKTWGLGHANIGAVTFESAGYIARYTTKKITGDLAHDHYSRTCPDTGEIYQLEPEFLGMSLKPGIGQNWFNQFGQDSFKKDQVILNGKALRPPRAYYKWLEANSPKLATQVRRDRSKKQRESKTDPRKDTFNLYNAQDTISRAKTNQREMK